VASEPDFQALAATQSQFLEAYRAQKWHEAEVTLRSLSGSAEQFGLSKLHAVYAGRIQIFRAVPPGENWDGVFEATHK
jgi:adenylate cyclase